MAILTIKSNNVDLSWVLCKNPDSGVSTRAIRQGIGFGWFTENNPQEYNLYFKDGEDVDSFSKTNFDYLSQGTFGSPLAYMGLISTFLRDVVKGNSDKDVVTYNEVKLHQVLFKGVKLFEHLCNHLSLSLEYKETLKGVYEVTFSGEATLHEVLNTCLISCLFLSGEEGLHLTKIDEAFITKYANIIKNLDLPYYLRYVFARNYFKSADQFNKFKHFLEKDGIVLSHGDTGFQRLRFIEKHLDNCYPILDVGCGEGMYALNFPKRNKFPYHAVDIDEDLIESVQAKAKARGFDVTTYNSVDLYENNEVVDILFTEVIEHMSLDEGEGLFQKLLKMKFRKLFITTPDKSFNKNYLIEDGGFRHDDHKWEMDSEEFKSWVEMQLEKANLDVEAEYYGIGDCVDGTYTSQGFIITNKNIPKRAIITVGCSASGKSTFADNICKTSDSWIEINRDNIRFRNGAKDWDKYKFTKQNEQRVQIKWEKQLYNAIEQEKGIIVSDTNLNKHHLEVLVNKLQNNGYVVTVKHFDVDFETLLKRDNQRKGGVGYEVLLSQFIRYNRNFKSVVVYEPDHAKRPAYIFDIDGTIADKGNRSPYDVSRVLEDKPIESVISILKGLWENGNEIIFLSGRDVECAGDTRQWLIKNVGDFTQDCLLVMREHNDVRKDYIVKMEMFDKYVRNNYNVKAVFDDRKQVIEQCWEVLGLKTINVGNPIDRF